MIDWLNVLYNALWIVGLAVVLAAFSHSDWQAARRGLSLRQVLDSPPFQQLLSLGLLLVSLSLALLATRGWERGLWLVFALLFAGQGWDAVKAERRRQPREKNNRKTV